MAETLDENYARGASAMLAFKAPALVVDFVQLPFRIAAPCGRQLRATASSCSARRARGAHSVLHQCAVPAGRSRRRRVLRGCRPPASRRARADLAAFAPGLEPAPADLISKHMPVRSSVLAASTLTALGVDIARSRVFRRAACARHGSRLLPAAVPVVRRRRDRAPDSQPTRPQAKYAESLTSDRAALSASLA